MRLLLNFGALCSLTIFKRLISRRALFLVALSRLSKGEVWRASRHGFRSYLIVMEHVSLGRIIHAHRTHSELFQYFYNK